MYKKVYRQVGGALPSTIPRQHVGLLGVLPGAPTPTPLSGTLPPQNQGLSGLDPHAYMRRTVDDYVKSYNLARQGTGAAAQRVMERPRLVAGTGLRSIREGVGDQTIDPINTIPSKERTNELANQTGRIFSEFYGTRSGNIPSDQNLTPIYTGVPPNVKESIMDRGFTGDKVFVTPDITTARTYATDSGPLKGIPYNYRLGVNTTGDILEAQVPTSQVESMVKKGPTGTRELVIDPETASKTFQTGRGDIVEAPSKGHKTAKILGRVLPGVGTALGVIDLEQRLHNKDWGGAALSLASMAPGIGIPATLAQIATDYFGWTGGEGKALQNQLEAQAGGIPALPESPITPTTPAIPEVQVSIEPFYTNIPSGSILKPVDDYYDALRKQNQAIYDSLR